MDAPPNYKLSGALMIGAGIVNIVLSLIWVCGAIGSLYGIFCCWVPIFPFAIGVLEIVTGVAMAKGEPRRHIHVISIAGGVSGILMCFGIVPLILEIIAIVLTREAGIQAWLAEKLAEQPAQASG